MTNYPDHNMPESFDDYELGMGATGRRDNAPRTKANTPRPDREAAEPRTLRNEARAAEPRRRPAGSAPAGASTKRPAPARRPKKPSYGLKDFICDYRTHFAAGVFLCVAAVVMICVSVSFLFNGKLDQSVTHGRTIAEIVDSGAELANAGGAVGARIAHFLMVDTLGIGSFILAVYIFLIGLWAIRAIRIDFITLTFKSLYSAVAVSLIAGLLTFNTESFFHFGGNHGYYINDMIQRFAGSLGAYAVALVLLGGLVAIYLHPLRTFFRIAIRAFRGVREKLPDGLGEKVSSLVKPSPVSISSLDEGDEPLSTADVDTEDAAEDESTEEISERDENAASDSEPAREGFGMAAIEALDDEDERPARGETQLPEVESREVPATPAPQAIRTQERAATPVAVQTPHTGPALTITNIATPDSLEHEVQELDMPEIHDGDHLGLDSPYDHRAELGNYKAPSTEILIDRPAAVKINTQEQQEKTDLIVNALRSYGVEIAEVKATIGPTVTLFEIVPAEGVKIAKIKNLEDDIAMNLAALGIRIIAPMPGKGTIGIEVPNRDPQIVGIRTVLESEAYERAKHKMALPMALGATISNDIFIADLTKMPHLLVAGATGQGKSVGLNAIITSLIYAKHPSELKFVLIDPKRVEFSVYKALENHYMAKVPGEDNPIITDPMKAVSTLQSLCEEMEARYDLLSDAGVRDIAKYNERFCQRRLTHHKGHRYLPYIVIIVDEFADLTMVAGKDVSLPIARIAQKARAVGMHMILATQRPSTDVITGMIKANFPGRIAFRVQQMVDSRTILDSPGANRLIGRGDMLFSNSGQMERVQCALVDTEEIEAIVDTIGSQVGYATAYELPEPPAAEGTGGPVDLMGGSVEISKRDDTFMQCARFVGTQNVASTSMLQRKFKIGFNRAGRIMEDLQNLGIVGPPNGSNPRQVLMTTDEVEQVLSNL